MKNDDVVALWQAQSSDGFRMSSEEIRSRIETMNRKMRRRTIDGYLVCAVMIAFFVGWMIVGMNTAANRRRRSHDHRPQLHGLADSREPFPTPSIDAVTRWSTFGASWRGSAIFTGARASGGACCSSFPVGLIFFAGFAQAHPEVIRIIRFEIISFVVFALAAIPLNLWMARRYQKQIDALARLQEEK